MNTPASSPSPKKGTILSIDDLEQLWEKAIKTRTRESIEEYVDAGVTELIYIFGILQDLSVLSKDGEGGSWLTRTLQSGVDEWFQDGVWTIEQASTLGIDFPSIKKLAEGIQFDQLIQEQRKKVVDILKKR